MPTVGVIACSLPAHQPLLLPSGVRRWRVCHEPARRGQVLHCSAVLSIRPIVQLLVQV